MPTPGKERQAGYRFWHPQLNVTFAWRSDYHLVVRACAMRQITPRDVLIRWARNVVANETAGVPPIPDQSLANPQAHRRE